MPDNIPKAAEAAKAAVIVIPVLRESIMQFLDTSTALLAPLDQPDTSETERRALGHVFDEDIAPLLFHLLEFEALYQAQGQKFHEDEAGLN